MGGLMVQWRALSPHRKKVLGSIPTGVLSVWSLQNLECRIENGWMDGLHAIYACIFCLTSNERQRYHKMLYKCFCMTKTCLFNPQMLITIVSLTPLLSDYHPEGQWPGCYCPKTWQDRPQQCSSRWRKPVGRRHR